jgi:hypothetical protein
MPPLLVAGGAARTRCQNCGQPLRSRHRGLMLWIGVGGVTVLAFVVGLMWLVVRNDDLMTAPPPVDEASQAPKQFPQFGDVSKAPDKSAQKEPEKPKQPPLNQ